MSEQKTPWNPSRKATARVKNPLPPITECPHCGSKVNIEPNSTVYRGRSYGEWPWVYVCEDDECDSYVGLHPYTSIPLGTLANKQIREARKRSKAVFNQYMNEKGIGRSQAYSNLAQCMGIDVNDCHFGWFDVQQCDEAQTHLHDLIEGKAKNPDSPFAKLKGLLNR